MQLEHLLVQGLSVNQSASNPLELTDVLEKILSFLDDDSLNKASAVCRHWHHCLRTSKALWSSRLPEGLVSQDTSDIKPSLFSVQLACFQRNLLRNAAFIPRLNSAIVSGFKPPWVFNGDKHAWKIPVAEHHVTGPSMSPDPMPGRRSLGLARIMQGSPKSHNCIVTGTDWCEVIQVLNVHDELKSRGLDAATASAVLDAGLPMALTVYIASHANHRATFAVGLLLDNGEGPVPNPQRFVVKPSTHFYFSGKLNLNKGSGWQRFSYLLPSCPVGFRRAMVIFRGRAARITGAGEDGDTLCGPKFSSPALHFLNPQQFASFKETASSEAWSLPAASDE